MATEEQTDVHGYAAPGFEVVRDAFAANFDRRGEVGAAFAAYVDGEPVVDLWAGVADAATGAPWERDTLQLIFSGTKGVVATALLLLVERGQLALEEPVATYWPEFAQSGKQAITVGDVLSHQAGLPWLDADVTGEALLDDEALAALLARQAPLWPGDRRVSYHPLTYGWLCGELVRRVADTTVGALVRAEIAEPLGAEIWIGLPSEQEPRVSTLCVRDDFRALGETLSATPGARRYGNPPIFEEPLLWNLPAVHAAEVPGANGIATARGMAALYGCLAGGGTLGGRRLLSEHTVALGPAERARGVDPLSDERLAFGAGFELQTERSPFGPALDGYGHGGAGGSMHGAWPKHRVGFSYAMNQMRDDSDDDRSRTLLAALYTAVANR